MEIRNDDSGFTLIEMLVAVSVASVILLMVYTTYNSIIKSIAYGKKVSSYYMHLNQVINRIDYDLTHLYWKDGIKNLQFVSLFNGRSSIISFVSAEYKDNRIILAQDLQYPVSDIHETGYYLHQKPGDRNYALIRKTDISYNDSISEGGFEEELLTDVISIRFDFQYRGDWSDNWNTDEQKRLPRAIKTSLEVLNPFNKVEKYTIISLPGLANE